MLSGGLATGWGLRVMRMIGMQEQTCRTGQIHILITGDQGLELSLLWFAMYWDNRGRETLQCAKRTIVFSFLVVDGCCTIFTIIRCHGIVPRLKVVL